MIDYNELEKALRGMQPRQKLYELVKTEMQTRGRWKNESRGWHIKGVKKCSIAGCDNPSINGFYCKPHNVSPQGYGVTQKRLIPLYGTWVNMLNRCYNEKIDAYKHYGARGIGVCNRWRESFVAFREDMGERPSPRYSIDRIDVNGNYEPGNCRWADSKTQLGNRRK